jgi:hypothetical protein
VTNLRAGGGFRRAGLLVSASVPASMSGVSHGNGDETHQTFQQGRPALASHGRPSLAALAVGSLRALLSSRHVAGAGLALVRPAGRFPSGVAVVAAVCVRLPVHHRLVTAIAPLRADGLSREAAVCQHRLGVLDANALMWDNLCGLRILGRWAFSGASRRRPFEFHGKTRQPPPSPEWICLRAASNARLARSGFRM